MEISKTRIAAYVGAGATVGGGFAAIGAGRSPRVIALGVATGVAAAAAHTAVESQIGANGLGVGASLLTGAAMGALLLRGIASPNLSPIAQRGIGAAIGATVGVLAPVAAGILLAQVAPDA